MLTLVERDGVRGKNLISSYHALSVCNSHHTQREFDRGRVRGRSQILFARFGGAALGRALSGPSPKESRSVRA